MRQPDDFRERRRLQSRSGPTSSGEGRSGGYPMLEDLDVTLGDDPGSNRTRPWPERRTQDGESAHIGRRGLLRRELIGLAAGLLFVGLALAKPWSGGPFASEPTRRLPSPSASVERTGQVPTRTPEATPASDLTKIDLREVDWTGLRTPDNHANWGVAGAILSPGGSSGSSATTSASWVAFKPEAGSGQLTAIVPVRPGRHVYALAVTWPAEVSADGLVFTFDSSSSPSGPSPLDMFAPMTELYAVPAAQATASVTIDPQDPPAGIVSGQFWVGPVDKFTVPYIEPPAQQWRFGPWWWPTGEYRVTLSTQTGIRTLLVRLVPQS